MLLLALCSLSLIAPLMAQSDDVTNEWRGSNFARPITDTHDWTNVERLRLRFGIGAPLTSPERSWKLNTFYGIANFEPLYRFDKSDIDPFRAQVGWLHRQPADPYRTPLLRQYCGVQERLMHFILQK